MLAGIGLMLNGDWPWGRFFAMTVKPTSDDTWAILVVGAILLAGTAVFLRGMRETGPAGGIAQRDALRGVSGLL